jgi:hypothetical protein
MSVRVRPEHAQPPSGARPAHAAWRAHRCFTEDLVTTRFTARPPPQLKLYDPTQRPQWRRLERGPHWSNGGLAAAFGVEVDKQLPT